LSIQSNVMKKLTGPLLVIGSAGERADLLYASGFSALDPVVFLQHGRQRMLVVPMLELGRAREETRGVKVFTPDQLPVTARERRRLHGWALGLLRLAGSRKATVASTFPLGVAQRLKSAGIQLRVAKTSLFPRREIKREEEVRHLVQAQRAAVDAMRAATAMIASSRIGGRGELHGKAGLLTSEAVRAEIERTLMQHNCFAPETIVAGGDQAVDPHQRGTGPLKAGEAMVIDIFPQHRGHGYWGDITRTVVRGEPSKELLALYRAVKAAQAIALKMLKPRVALRKVHDAVSNEFLRRGYPTETVKGIPQGFFHSTGHGVGLEIHEGPHVAPVDGFLRAGHVVTIEPGLYYPGLGGVRIEDTVLITPHGYRCLATFPKKFIL
jgi:Xaa-Pro aminopeptidase